MQSLMAVNQFARTRFEHFLFLPRNGALLVFFKMSHIRGTERNNSWLPKAEWVFHSEVAEDYFDSHSSVPGHFFPLLP